MTDSGTIQETTTLSTPKTGQEYEDMLNKAVSEGNTEEVNRLMTLEWTPDPDASTEEEVVTTTGDEPVVDDKDKKPVVEDAQVPPVSQPTEVAPVATDSVPVQEPKVETPEEKLVKLEAELQRLRSDAGRVASLQSRLALLEKSTKIKETTKAKPVVEEESELSKKIKNSIKNLKEVDSDTAELLEAIRQEALEAAEKRVQSATESLAETITSHDEEARLLQEFDKVVAVHPEFDSIRRHVYWQRWKDSLTPEARAWAESDNSAQVIEAVRAFKEQMAAYPRHAPAPAATTPPPAPVVQTPPVEVVDDATKKAREQRLAASTATPTPAIKDSKQFDPQAMFSEMYAQIQKDNGIK